MTNEVAKKEEESTTTNEEEEEPTTTAIPPGFRERTLLPSVGDLLQNGDGVEREPQTFLQSLVLPGLLLIIFVASLAAFHFATNGFTGGNQGLGTDGRAYQQRMSAWHEEQAAAARAALLNDGGAADASGAGGEL